MNSCLPLQASSGVTQH